MGIGKQGMPVLPGLGLALGAAIGKLLGAIATKGVGSRVARVVKYRHSLTQLQRSPDHLAPVSSGEHASRKQKVVLAKMLHGLARNAGAKKRLKQQAHGLLHLEVWVEHDPSVAVLDETDGQLRTELAPACFVQKPAAQSGPHHVQLGLAHGALQTEKQSVVEVGRVVDGGP